MILTLPREILVHILSYACSHDWENAGGYEAIPTESRVVFYACTHSECHSWTLIRNYLSVKNTCKRFRDLINDPILFRVQYESNYEVRRTPDENRGYREPDGLYFKVPAERGLWGPIDFVEHQESEVGKKRAREMYGDDDLGTAEGAKKKKAK